MVSEATAGVCKEARLPRPCDQKRVRNVSPYVRGSPRNEVNSELALAKLGLPNACTCDCDPAPWNGAVKAIC